MTELIGTINAGQKVETRINLNRERGVVDIRHYDQITATGLRTVSKTGLPVAVVDLPDLIAALQAALLASNGGEE